MAKRALNVKKINSADFTASNNEDIKKLGRSLNPFFDSITQVLNKGLTVAQHLPFEYQEFEVEVDAFGVPKSPLKMSTELVAPVKGMIVVNAFATGSAPTATPFVVSTTDKNIITVSRVTGLPANTKFKITAMVVS
jgi:hypothetical protein